MNSTLGEQFLTARQLAARLGIPVYTIYKMSRAGLLPTKRIGVHFRGLRFIEAEVRDALSRPVAVASGEVQ